MDIDKDFLERLHSYHDSLALTRTFTDLNNLLTKYEEKITRQLNQAKRRNETLQKGNTSISTRSHALEEENILHYQIIHIKDLRIEYLQRTSDVLTQAKSVKEKYIASLKEFEDKERSQET